MTNAPCKFTSCKWIWIKQNVKQNVKQRPTRTNETKTKTQQTVVRNRNNQIVANDVNCFYYVSQFHTLSTQSVHTNQRIHMNKFYAVFVPIFVYFPFFLTLFSFLCFAFFISHFLVTFYFIIISLIHFVSWLLAAAIWLIYFVILCRLHINPFQQQNAFGQSFANIWCRTHTHTKTAHTKRDHKQVTGCYLAAERKLQMVFKCVKEVTIHGKPLLYWYTCHNCFFVVVDILFWASAGQQSNRFQFYPNDRLTQKQTKMKETNNIGRMQIDESNVWKKKKKKTRVWKPLFGRAHVIHKYIMDAWVVCPLNCATFKLQPESNRFQFEMKPIFSWRANHIYESRANCIFSKANYTNMTRQ